MALLHFWICLLEDDKKLKNSTKWNDDRVQMAVTILKTTCNNTITHDESLFLKINCGKLWLVTEEKVRIFEKPELNILLATQEKKKMVLLLKILNLCASFMLKITQNSELNIDYRHCLALISAF